MTHGAILAQIEAAGLRLSVKDGRLFAAPRDAITDELRALIRAHKAELLAALDRALPAAPGRAPAPHDEARSAPQGTGTPIVRPMPAPLPEPLPSALSGYDCTGCNRLEMREEPQPGARRRFFWRCTERFELLEGRNYGERVVLAPPECDRFTPWKQGTK